VISGEANGRFDAGERDQPDDELMNAVLLELQIKVGVGEAAGAPVLPGISPGAGTNSSRNSPPMRGIRRSCVGIFLNGRNVFPRLIVAGAVAMLN
jgi:hypothetical protein